MHLQTGIGTGCEVGARFRATRKSAATSPGLATRLVAVQRRA